MSRTIFKDIEEAILREVRRITFHDNRTLDKIVLKDTYDPFTGEIVQMPVEPDLYDSSADAQHIQYPHIFVKLVKTREDRFTQRGLPQYGRWIQTSVRTAPRAYEIIVSGSDGIIASAGNVINTSLFNINKLQVGYFLRLLSGNNKGTYIISAFTPDALGNHSIEVSSTLISSLPESNFNSTDRIVTFSNNIDLSTVKVGDVFTDNSAATFNILAVDSELGTIEIDGVVDPDLAAGGTITRAGNVFTVADLTAVRFLVMDPAQPIQTINAAGCDQNVTDSYVGVSPKVPVDAFYLVRIDSKEQPQHIHVLNRMWEEFNPPRTALPVIARTSISAEQLITVEIPDGGTNTITVEDNSNFNVGDPIVIIDQLTPSKDSTGYERPFSSTIVSKNIDIDGINTITLADTVPDTFDLINCPLVVSNTEFQLLMFHFVDHNTKDIEGSQYWVHEFNFWVQLWIDRLEDPKETSAVTNIDTISNTNLDGIEILD